MSGGHLGDWQRQLQSLSERAGGQIVVANFTALGLSHLYVQITYFSCSADHATTEYTGYPLFRWVRVENKSNYYHQNNQDTTFSKNSGGSLLNFYREAIIP